MSCKKNQSKPSRISCKCNVTKFYIWMCKQLCPCLYNIYCIIDYDIPFPPSLDLTRFVKALKRMNHHHNVQTIILVSRQQ